MTDEIIFLMLHLLLNMCLWWLRDVHIHSLCCDACKCINFYFTCIFPCVWQVDLLDQQVSEYKELLKASEIKQEEAVDRASTLEKQVFFKLHFNLWIIDDNFYLCGK